MEENIEGLQMIAIETDRLIIRPIRLEDAEAMFAYASDPVLAEYVAWDVHKSIEDSLAFIHMAIEHQKVKPLDPLAIAFKDKPDVIIGAIEIKTTSNPYEGIISYVLARQYWRQGLMYEAGCALVDLAFKEYGFKRIFAFCIKENKASSSLMKKLGMKFEGFLRSRLYRKEQLWDVEYYAILEDEWRQQKSFAAEQGQNEYPISYEPNASPEDKAFVDKGICDYAKQQKGMDPFEFFDFFVRDKHGQILAGCGGVMSYGCLYTGSLWVTEAFRGKGFGTRLLQAAENLALKRECTMATLHTMDWEALDFYKQQGYQIELVREGHKNNSIMYILKKGL